MVRKVLPFVVILEDLRSARNVGHCLRSAAVFGATAVHLTGISARPAPGYKGARKVLRGSLGAEQEVPWVATPSVAASVALLRCRWPRILVAAAETRQRSLDSAGVFESFAAVHPHNGMAIILGNERIGLSEAALTEADVAVHLPLYGSKESLLRS
eukprot:Hpha_TRINITY_DN27916_c0_g1::TRINITY_DN27916_c0_g1_i1::g.45081::m.45081